MSFHSASVRALLSRDFDGAAQLLQEIDKAALVCPQPYRAARAIRARGRHAARRSASRWARRRAAVSVAVFSRFAIYANVVGRTNRTPGRSTKARRSVIELSCSAHGHQVLFQL